MTYKIGPTFPKCQHAQHYMIRMAHVALDPVDNKHTQLRANSFDADTGRTSLHLNDSVSWLSQAILWTREMRCEGQTFQKKNFPSGLDGRCQSYFRNSNSHLLRKLSQSLNYPLRGFVPAVAYCAETGFVICTSEVPFGFGTSEHRFIPSAGLTKYISSNVLRAWPGKCPAKKRASGDVQTRWPPARPARLSEREKLILFGRCKAVRYADSTPQKKKQARSEPG
jgi:hypothetical protein